MLNCSSDGVLELEPMDPYNRLLLHRLADIFGYFSLNIYFLSNYVETISGSLFFFPGYMEGSNLSRVGEGMVQCH